METLIKGISIKLHETVIGEPDPFGAVNTHTEAVIVNNVLVNPTMPDDIVQAENLWGKKAVYTLAIPKGDAHNWEDAVVEFFGEKFKTFGSPAQGIEHLIPLDWNKKVMVERYE